MGKIRPFWTSVMGKDLKHKNQRQVRRKAPKSKNDYLSLLVKVYRFLERRTGSKFTRTILKRLYMSRANLPPVPVSKVAKQMAHPSRKGLVSVIVGTITNDVRFYDVPKNMKICALHVTDSARARIEAKGGEIMTFDQLAKLLYFCKAAEGLASDSGISVEHLVYLGHTLALTFVIRDANSKKPEEDVVAPVTKHKFL